MEMRRRKKERTEEREDREIEGKGERERVSGG